MDDRHFDRELEGLNSLILAMGLEVEKMIQKALKALLDRNVSLAREILDEDRQIDLMELEVDEKCLELLALYQPVAVDLRFITTAMLIVTDLERIGDMAVGIAGKVIELGNEPLVKPLVDIPKMVEIAVEMLKKSLDAFVKRDTNLAKQVPLLEDKADDLRNQISAELQQVMMKDTKNVPGGLILILISRHLERIADHATNIAEDVVYMVDAEVIKHKKREDK